MIKKNILITIGLVFLFTVSFLLLSSYKEEHVFAQTTCPSNIDPDSLECLDYLRNQLGILQKQQGNIQKQLKNEEYQQLSLTEKISYINNQIEQTERVIKSLEVEIAANDVEIKLLEDAILELEDNIGLLRQEMGVLENSVTKRVTESYKYSFVGPLELFMDLNNLSSLLRKTKYLAATRSQDKKYLQEYGLKIKEIENEEEILGEKKSTLQTVRNSIEQERIALAESRKDLSNQKSEREKLLAESKAKEAELIAAYQQNIQKLADLDKAIINYINTHQSEIVDGGWVTTGIAIGRMGNTGCSSGSHLHFGLNSGKRYDGWGYFYSDVNLFSNGYLTKGGNSFLYWSTYNWWSPLILSGSVRVPLSGNYILMTQDEHQGNAIDLVSYSQNAWGYKNEGAPIYPIMNGQLYKGVEGVCGGKYAIVHHTNGMVSVYLHLQ